MWQSLGCCACPGGQAYVVTLLYCPMEPDKVTNFQCTRLSVIRPTLWAITDTHTFWWGREGGCWGCGGMGELAAMCMTNWCNFSCVAEAARYLSPAGKAWFPPCTHSSQIWITKGPKASTWQGTNNYSTLSSLDSIILLLLSAVWGCTWSSWGHCILTITQHNVAIWRYDK